MANARFRVGLAAAAVLFGAVLGSSPAQAQQATFHLDRLEMPGSPDDGLVLFRPVTHEQGILFAQLGLGYSLNPLHTTTITSERTALLNSHDYVIQNQLTQYTTIGAELGDRLILAATLPITWWQSGANPNYGTPGITGGPTTTVVDTSGPSMSDVRVDLRYVAWRSLDRKMALGAQLSVFGPSGNGSRSNFGGDGSFAALPMVTGEYTLKFITFVANVGIHFRPYNTVNDPVHSSGLGIGDEFRWAVGAFIPLQNGKHRIGGTLFGQTGLESTDRIGDTFFRGANTPIEWNAEWRMKLTIGPWDRFWVGAGGGTRIAKGYGAPDLRVVGLFGAYIPIFDSDATSPDVKKVAKSDRDQMRDTDHDGIPDELDPCPLDPEDHQEPDPNDGCPKLPDRDGDGIPDKFDKCPDEPGPGPDGCPKKGDTDQDGIPDATDACPREPGQPDPDPKKNGCPKFIKLEGSQVRILQQVHFQTASAVILPDSFPMLLEIVNLLKANPSIKKMMIEGHTDSDGPAPYNLRLSDQRAASVRAFLVQHGVDAKRLDSHGYGEEKPIADNGTADGRAANRRVEFKITEEDK
jgi:outer membrane protein OmpA-like peptidoglycan-associated protein